MTNQKDLIKKQAFIESFIKNKVPNEIFEITFVRHLQSSCIVTFKHKITCKINEAILDFTVDKGTVWAKLNMRDKVLGLVVGSNLDYRATISTSAQNMLDILEHQAVSINTISND